MIESQLTHEEIITACQEYFDKRMAKEFKVKVATVDKAAYGNRFVVKFEAVEVPLDEAPTDSLEVEA